MDGLITEEKIMSLYKMFHLKLNSNHMLNTDGSVVL